MAKEYIATGVMHTCTRCGLEQDTSQFPVDKTYKQGFANKCRQCFREVMKERRATGLAPMLSSTNLRKRELVRAAKEMPCADCGESFPYFVMDLDHLPGFVKKFRLGEAANYTEAEVKSELLKCEAVCANCHRHRTAKRAGLL